MEWLRPDWPASARVRAATSLRSGGVSAAPFDSLNLAAHVGDARAAVETNRLRLRQALALPASPCWLRQVHGTHVQRLPPPAAGAMEPGADAAWTSETGVVCAVLTADCLPLLLCDAAGTCVAAVHAGWRGLAAGIIERCVAALPVPPARLLAWLGPAIGPDAFEIGAEVRERFVGQDPAAADAFRPGSRAGKYLGDLYALARLRLGAAGVRSVHGGGFCTVGQPQCFYSYRRDGRCGRMATLVWLDV